MGSALRHFSTSINTTRNNRFGNGVKMANWHGYFVVERQNIGAGNWVALRALFEEMGTLDSTFPAFNNHRRDRLDDNAVIYESLFDTSEVSILKFKQLLSDEFGVPIEDIDHETTAVDYAGFGTTVWEFLYGAIERFRVERFGSGGTWSQSGDECRAYLAANRAEWEPVGV